MKRADIVASVLLVILALLAFREAGTYASRGVQIEYFGPAFFPQILAIALIVCACLQVGYAVLGLSLRRIDFIDRRGFIRMAASFVLAVAYWLAIDWTGFYLGTPIFLFLLMTLMGSRDYLKRIGAAIAAPAGVWLIFEKFLVIDMPPGVILPAIFGS